MRILYISQYYPPEIGAPAARVGELSRIWAAAGYNVMVLTGFPSYPTGRVPAEYSKQLRKLFMRETLQGVEVRRTWLIALPNRKSWERMLYYGSFCISAILRGIFLPTPNLIIATSPPLLVGLSGFLIAKCKRVPFVFEVRDLWPESLQAVGVAGKRSFLVAALRRLAKLLYRRANHIVVVTNSIKRHLENEYRVPPNKISVIMNAVDERMFVPDAKDRQISQEFYQAGRFIVTYVGTIGNAHGVDTVLEAAELLITIDPEIMILLVGEGAEWEQVQQAIAARRLSNIVILHGHSRSKVPAILGLSHVSLVLLKKSELFRGAVPTKMLEAMACERPIILAIEGEAADLLERAGAGICVPPQSPKELAGAILKLKANPHLRRLFGRKGREFILREFTRNRTSMQYTEVLQRVLEGS